MAMAQGKSRFRPLAELLGDDSPHATLHAGWIEDRAALCNRMWSPASMAATCVAREAVADAGWSGSDLRDAALILGTSRGNAAGWLAPWPGRRPFRTMAVSNTIHNEPASAVSIQLGIHGPSHVLSSGCSAGLDALGVAMMILATGKAERALIVAVDLPLVPALLDSYAASGLLSQRHTLDPYNPESDGFIPAEAAAAIAIEISDKPGTRLMCHLGNCDAANPLAIPADGGRTPDLMKAAIARHGIPSLLVPHATGTVAQARAELAMFDRMFSTQRPEVCLLKPWIGHTLGASGLIETTILADFLRRGRLPPSFPSLTPMLGMRFRDATPIPFSGTICKLAHSLGGHNSLLYLQHP
jgi:3-oxoacyl-(acyl-carrier-protein) synthase